jgi:hypothetical protein
MEQMQPQHAHHGGHDRHDLPRHSAGRVIVYLIASIILNVLLAVYLLYMLGVALAFDWTILKSGTLQVILESALQLLLFFSPVILTIILNRLLYRVFRGRKRFPHGMWFFAMLVMIVVQVAAIAFIVSYGFVGGANGLNIEQLAVTPIG